LQPSTFGFHKTTNMQRIFTLLVFILIASFSFAQKNTTVKGTVYDTLSKKGLSYATISLVNARDSTLINFVRADSTGNFSMKQVSKGKYLLSTSYVGFMPVWKDITVNNEEEIDLGNITLTDVNIASNVTVQSKRPPVVINGDTLEFNSENFKTQPNAVVEDLLKKLPGVTVDADGTVRVNGQRVSRVLVNGKDFFNGDPRMATKNLDADAIDKVQVFDKKSDRAEFTGIDDGNSQKAINLKLKKDRDNAVFGRVAAGAGENERYDGQTNINKFKGDKQMSLIGMGNNTNRQGFSISDVMNFTGELGRGMRNGGGMSIRMGGDDPGNGLPVTGLGQNQQGVAETFAGGLNYNNNWNKKTDLNASGILSDIHLVTDRGTERQYLFPGNNYTYSSNSSSVRDIKQQRVNFALDQKIDSFTSLKITPSLTFQQQKNKSHSSYLSQNTSKVKLNDGYNNSSSTSNGYTFAGDALLRHKFRKKGRTISANINVNTNDSEQEGDLQTKNTFYPIGLPAKDSLLNQINSNDANSKNIGTNVAYTEPIGKRSLIEFAGFYSTTVGESNRKTYDYNTLSGKHDVLNNNLSNNFKSDYEYKGGSINFRSNQPKFNYGVGASLQDATLKSINKTNNNIINQQFTDVLPLANFNYKFSNYKNMRLDYSTSTQQPSTSQLQPFQNISDPLNVVEGNPDLKRSYSHSISLNYFAANPATRKNFFAMAFVNFTQNAIVYADEFQNNGARKSKPVNTNGNMNFFSNINYGFPIKKLKTRVDASIGYNSTKSISFINGAKNQIVNMGINPSVSLNYSKDDKIDIRTTATLRFSKATYSLQEQLNTNYLTQTYGAEMTNYLPLGLVLNNNFTYTINTGRADGYNTKVPFWNASIAKSFLKNKRAELKLTVFDLLNENIGISRSANQNYIEDQRYSVLQRYLLATFTFRLHKAAASNGPQVMIRTMGN
jgi:hypothetical protein